MSAALTWLTQHVPVFATDDGTLMLHWKDDNGHLCEAPAEFVAEKFGAAIEQALESGEDVLEAVLSSDYDAGWHDIWRWWRQLGYI